MAGEDQYINPIIQAMAGLRQRQEHQENLQLETQRLKSESSHQDAVLKELSRQHDLEHDLAQRKFEEVDLPLLKARMANEKFQQGANLINLVRNGAGPQLLGAVGAKVNPANMGPNVAAQGPPPGVPQGVDTSTEPSVEFNGAQIPMSAIQNAPAEEAARIRGLAAAQSGGAAEGALPYKELEAEQAANRVKDLAKFNHDFTLDLNKRKQDWETGENAKKIKAENWRSQLERGTQVQLENMRSNTQKTIAGLGGGQEDGDRIQTRMEMLGLGLDKASQRPIDQVAEAHLMAQGWKPTVDPKDVSQAKSLSTMNPLLDRLQQFANTRSENPMMAYLQGLSAEHSPIETKAQNDLAQIRSQVLKAGKALEGQEGSRVSVKQLGLELDSLTDPHITQAQATERVGNIRGLLESEAGRVTAGMAPTQKDAFLKFHQVDLPKYANTNPQNPASGHRIVTYNGGKTFYDAQTGKPVTQAPPAAVVPAGKPIVAIPPAGMQQGTISTPPPEPQQ